ncbi:MAG: family 10 glycosylhydrolase [Lachnospiraceae bacterium]|nr:family 10 glycosylhydrolase [Lachnospiraceae bacterium]
MKLFKKEILRCISFLSIAALVIACGKTSIIPKAYASQIIDKTVESAANTAGAEEAEVSPSPSASPVATSSTKPEETATPKVSSTPAATPTPASKPVITLKKSTSKKTNKNIKISLSVSSPFGFQEVRFIKGYKSYAYTMKKGKKLSVKSTVTKAVSKNGKYTFAILLKTGQKFTKKVNIKNIDKTRPTLNVSYKTDAKTATVTVSAKDKGSGIRKICYLKGAIYDKKSTKWKKAKDITKKKKFSTKTSSEYTILAIDKAGNRTIERIHPYIEVRAMWISYIEYDATKYKSYAGYKKTINKMFDNCVKYGMNTVYVHVRPFSDALYPSAYFPWSEYASGDMGKNPGYDPLGYMVKAAHNRNLRIEAWINPYRIASSVERYKSLPASHPAKVWSESKDKTKHRNVLVYNGALYYNPASLDVQNLIINGAVEIVRKYDVDGIHMDDYFYPSLGNDYKKKFDYKEFESYVAGCKARGSAYYTIVKWRRENVNRLVREMYSAVKKVDSKCLFGISPAGNIDNLRSIDSYYVDIDTWLSTPGYVDYICPQIYWSFKHPSAPYKKVVDRWKNLYRINSVKLYIGIAAYRAGISPSNATQFGDMEWSSSNTIMNRQIRYARNYKEIDGFAFFSYQDFQRKGAKKEVKNLLKVLK